MTIGLSMKGIVVIAPDGNPDQSTGTKRVGIKFLFLMAQVACLSTSLILLSFYLIFALLELSFDHT